LHFEDFLICLFHILQSTIMRHSDFLAAFLISLIPASMTAQDRDALIAEIRTPPSAALPVCATPRYVNPSGTDLINQIWSPRKKFRLVIGAGLYKLAPDKNRDFIAPTAALVDSKLDKLGYKALPSQQHPLLIDADATKANIVAALKEMAQQVGKDGIGIVYYAGHGLITPSHLDLALGVYDEDVQPTNGLTVSNVLGLLGVDSTYVDNVEDIPNIFLVLEACESGQATVGDSSVAVTNGDIQLVQKIQTAIIPPTRVAILTATTHGGNHDAYPLSGMNVSAFGYYFSRALDEDWACTNKPTREGILVNSQLQEYLAETLDAAYKNHLIDGQMKPTILPKDDFAIWAYKPDRQADCGGTPCPGNRDRFVRLLVNTNPNQVAEFTLPNGFHQVCNGDAQCSVIMSKNMVGKISLTVTTVEQGIGIAPGEGPGLESKKSGSANFGTLLSKGSLNVAGVKVQIQK
jgi:hypothetical protein